MDAGERDRPAVVRPATAGDVEAIASVLREADAWVAGSGGPMWVTNELTIEAIAADVHAGLMHVAVLGGDDDACGDTIIGTVRFQLEDRMFWPDLPPDHDSAFIHRLAVRRAHAKRGVSTALLTWSADHARAVGRRHLRLDCDAARLRLRAVYERFGFRHHSDRQVGPYFVARYVLELP